MRAYKVLLPRIVYAANAKFVAFYHKPKPKRVWLLGLGFGFGVGNRFRMLYQVSQNSARLGIPDRVWVLGLAFGFWVWLLSLAFGSRQHV